MSPPTGSVYRFDEAAHWEVGARRNLILVGDRLVVPPALEIEPVLSTGPEDGGSHPAVDVCGGLSWLRPRTQELVRLAFAGDVPANQGTLDLSGPAIRMQIRNGLIWVLTEAGLDRFHRATMQRLSVADLPDGWRAVDIAGDGGDGVWVLGVDIDSRWSLRSVDCWGRTCVAPIAIPVEGDTSSELSISSTADGRWIVAIDHLHSTRAFVVDVERAVVTTIELDVVHGDRPTLLALADGRVHLLTTTTEPSDWDDGVAVYEALSLEGDVEDRQDLAVPAAVGRPEHMVGGVDGLWLVAACGLAVIVHDASPDDGRWSTFITPALVSPEGSRSGWNRAEIDVTLPPGTTLEVDWAATDSSLLADRVGELLSGPATAGEVDELGRLLGWRGDAVSYAGRETDAAGSAEPETLAVLLDGVEHPIVWLRLRFWTPPTRVPPSLSGLRVRYPDLSYLDHLPAIYRENPAAARRLRQLLAPYELLLDDLDQVLTSLPGRIDPATTTDDWSAYLLRWLGFPPLVDLPAGPRRRLLEQAAVLLDLRGTADGLRLVLDLVTGGRATVTDAGDRAAGWVLAAGSARLGLDTVALAQRPEPSRSGSMTLGQTPLGRGCPDPALVLADRAFVVTVTLELSPEEQRSLQPVIERLLPLFVPAHCRLEVIYTGSDGADRTRQLDVDFRLGPGEGDDSLCDRDAGPSDARLYGDAHWQLGSTARLGGWTLPDPLLPPLVLDHRARLGAGPRLH